MYITKIGQYLLLLLRLITGWALLSGGISRLVSDNWSILTSLQGSHILPDLFAALTTQPILGILDLWYPNLLIIAGFLVFAGLWMRVGSIIGILALALVYIPTIRFDILSTSAYAESGNMLLIVLLCLLTSLKVDEFWGLGANIHIKK